MANSRLPPRWKTFRGFPDGIEGPLLVENIKRQAEHFGAEYLHGTVVEADLSATSLSTQGGSRVGWKPAP